MYIKKMDKNVPIGGATLNDFDFKKLDRYLVKYEDRLKVVEEMLDGNTFFEELYETHFTNIDNKQKYLIEDCEFALRLQALANYLLFAQDVKRGRQLEYNTYENNTTLDAKHRKTISTEGLSEKLPTYEKNVEDIKKKNYKLSKNLNFANINKRKLVKEFPFTKDYYDLLKYLDTNKETKVKKNKIQQDLEYIANKNVIRFKSPLKEDGVDVDINNISFSDKKVIKYFMTIDDKESYDFSNNMDVLIYDFNCLYKQTELKPKLKEIAEMVRAGLQQKQIAQKLGITQQQVSKYYNQIVSEIVKQNIKNHKRQHCTSNVFLYAKKERGIRNNDM
jgi:hypothetical protein